MLINHFVVVMVVAAFSVSTLTVSSSFSRASGGKLMSMKSSQLPANEHVAFYTHCKRTSLLMHGGTTDGEDHIQTDRYQ